MAILAPRWPHPNATQEMKTELTWVNPNVFQVLSESIPNTAVADRFVWDTILQKPFSLEMGLKMRSRELREMQNLSKYLLSILTGHAELDSSEITTSFLLVVLAFLHLNNHEAFMERDVTSNSRNIIKSEKPSETKNIHGNIR